MTDVSARMRGRGVMFSSRLADACQAHDPGDYPAAYPYRVTADRGSLRAAYSCPVCGDTWTCWWDRRASGWPRRVPQVQGTESAV